MDGYQDEDGCPEPGPDRAVVTRTDTRLLLNQRIFFDFDSDTLRSVSFPILNEVATTLRLNGDITRLRVEATPTRREHLTTTPTCPSAGRGAVVDYLALHGVTREHLEFQGYGQGHPVADDRSPEGQALNRRVEFTIVSQSGAGPAAAATVNPDVPARGHHHHAHRGAHRH